MDQNEIHNLALGLRSQGTHFAVAVTGGGAPVASSLFVLNGEGGASSFMLDFRIPYSMESCDKLCRGGLTGPMDTKDVPSVSLSRAKLMAFSMWKENFAGSNKVPLVGLSLTAKLTYPGEREGREHEAYLAAFRPYFGAWLPTHKPQENFAWRLNFPIDSNRIDQELICAEAVVRVMRFMAHVDASPARPGLALQVIA
jgi:hypothetical protein